MNLKQRFDIEDFEDLSLNDAIRLVAACLEYAEIIPDKWGDDSETREANIIKRFRDTDGDYGIVDRDGGLIIFDFEGMEYELRTEDVFETYASNMIETYIDEARYEWENAKKSYFFANYLVFDNEMMYRDLWMEKEELCASYDGVVHECYLSCWDSDHKLYSTGTTYYLWRTN
jgi:hypothetical protein